jgi:hypothetical protein
MPDNRPGCSAGGISSLYMRLLEALASIFINVFGITQPTDETRRKAAWFILILLVVALLIVAAVGFVLYQVLGR